MAALHAFVHELHERARPEFFKARDVAAIESELASSLEDPNVHVFLAEDERDPLGYALSRDCERAGNALCHPRRWCEIDQLAVHALHRKRGVARALVEAAVADAASRGIDLVEATTWAFNGAAQETFRALGFEPRILRFERRTGR